MSTMDVSASENKAESEEVGVPLASQFMTSDYNIFASHPLEFEYFLWNTSTTYGNISLDVWNTFVTTAGTNPLGKKLANLRFYSGNITFKFVVQGSPYAQGKLVFSFDPYPLDTTTGLSALRIQPPQKVRSLLLPHVAIDPSKNCTYEISLPPPNKWGMYSTSRNYGSYSLNFIAFNPLGSGTALEPVVSVTIFASIQSVDLGVLTFTSSVSKKEEMKISSFFNVASDFSNSLSKYTSPPITMGLNLFSTVSSSISLFLEYFGYGKHIIRDVNYVRQFNTAQNLTLVDSKIDSSILGVRVTNSLSISPHDCPMLTQDDQLFQNLCRRPGLVDQYPVTTSATGGSLLSKIYITPTFSFPADSPLLESGYELSPLGFSSFPFAYWRGDIQIDIEIICSVFHRCTLLFAYFPNYFDNAVTYANALQTVHTWTVQVSGNTVETITIPWSQMEQFLPVIPVVDGGSTTPQNTNGNFITYLVNPVTTNGSTDPVWINYYFSCKNICLARPTGTLTGGYQLVLSSYVAPANVHSSRSTNEKNFYGRFFGERMPASVKELCNRQEVCLYTYDVVDSRPNPGCSFWTLPVAGFIDPTNNSQFPNSASANIRENISATNFAFVCNSYLGVRGTMDYTWFPGDAVDEVLTHVSSYITRNVGTSQWGYGTANGSNPLSPAGEPVATYNPSTQNGISVSFPYYQNGYFLPTFPSRTTGDAFYLNSNYIGGGNAAGTLFQSVGDDFNFVFFRGTPLSTY